MFQQPWREVSKETIKVDPSEEDVETSCDSDLGCAFSCCCCCFSFSSVPDEQDPGDVQHADEMMESGIVVNQHFGQSMEHDMNIPRHVSFDDRVEEIEPPEYCDDLQPPNSPSSQEAQSSRSALASVNHAGTDQASSPAEVARLGRGTSFQVVDDTAGGKDLGVEGHAPRGSPSTDEETSGTHEPGIQEEREVARIHCQRATSTDLRERDSGKALGSGTQSDSTHVRGPPRRQARIRETFRQNVCRSEEEPSGLRSMVHDYQVGRERCGLAHGQVPDVGPSRLEDNRDDRTEHDSHAEGRLQDSECQLRQCGVVCCGVRGQDGGGDGSPGRDEDVGGTSPRSTTSTSLGDQGPSDEGRRREPGGQTEEDLEDLKFDDGKKVHLSKATNKKVSDHFIRSFEDDWGALVHGGRLKLLEVCCHENSELSNACEQGLWTRISAESITPHGGRH